MKMFGAPDMAKDGKLSSHMPAWYLETQMDNLKEEIFRQENALKRGEVPANEVPEARALLARGQAKLAAIIKSRPSVSDQERNKLHKHYKELSALIQDTMFTFDDMNRGTADAHEEARRMKDPIISLNNDLKGLAKSCNVAITRGGKVGRDGATKIFKIVGRLLGEPTNVENLRRTSASTPGTGAGVAA